jgi:hypothetical protein
MKTLEATAGMNYIYDAIHYLNATVSRETDATCNIIRTYDYVAQRHYPIDARPIDKLTARQWGRGIRYTMNGRNVPGTQLVRVIGGLGIK